MIKKASYIALFLFIPQIIFAVTTPCKIRRICINASSNDITVFFNPVQDGCGSFVRYELWGRENTFSNYQYLTSSTNINSGNINYLLPNRKNWELKIYCLYACNGTDTLFSDSAFIDYSPPAQLEPDSVSVDLVTQQLQIGWSKAPENDIKEYSLYNVEANGNNQFLQNTLSSPYLFPLSQFDPSRAYNSAAIAVKDSCDNTGLVSNKHNPVFLSIDNIKNGNFVCTKSITIDWQAYIGWSTGSYEIYVKSTSNSVWTKIASVSASTFTYTYSFTALNETYSFFVRANKSASTITSSSNVVSFFAAAFPKPTLLEIGHVSVSPTNDYIEITSRWENNPLLFKNVILQKRVNGSSTWNNVLDYPIGNASGTFKDNNVFPNSLSYEYRLVLNSICGQLHDSSQIHISTLLSRQNLTFNWNQYLIWLNTTQTFANKENRSFTWNKINISSNSYSIPDSSSAKCYRIITYNNSPRDSAYSNTICISIKDSTIIPTGFSPDGQNKVFYIVNPNIKKGEAVMKIYNRWGMKLWEGDALEGWNGKDRNNNTYPMDVYAYLISIKRELKPEVYRGTIFILK